MPNTRSSCASQTPLKYLRLSQIVAPDGLLPIGKSTWWRYVAQKRVSAGHLISPRVRVWAVEDVLALLEQEHR